MEVCIPDDFDPEKIMDSGQCFRAVRLEDGSFRFLTGDQAVYLRRTGEERWEVSCCRETWERVWCPYFDLGRSYRAVREKIPARDTFLQEAARTGAGIRILRQDPWETLLTFIISQRKSIPAIRAMVEELSRRYGTELRTPVETLYAFPTPRQLKDVTVEDYIDCKAGYRAPYLRDAVERVLAGETDLEAIAALPDQELLTALEEVKGVGVKVASCVALFAYGRTVCAPVDTWIAKIIRKKYRGRDPFARYGDGAGIMQQYFFYYALRHKAETA